ncbi:MAG: hypothetical protein RL174_234 [Actinomycetota bacterium]|jgi:membrane protease YdiL (CAAX protease family)
MPRRPTFSAVNEGNLRPEGATPSRNYKAGIWFEIAVVFSLSLGASAAYSIVSLIAKLTAPSGLAGQTSKLNQSLADREWLDLTYQILGFAFGLAPVALVLFLLWSTGQKPLETLGLSIGRFGGDTARAVLLSAAVGIPGIALYLLARYLGLSSKVEPAALGQTWWAIPVLLMAALKAALLEEVIVVGYLQNRLGALGLANTKIALISAAIRGSYHLYQGFAGLVGNFVMGLIFAKAHQRFGRIMPLVLAHFIMDAFVFVGYSLLSEWIELP